MKPFFVLIAFAAGIINAVEAGTNTALRKGLGAPVWSVAAISAGSLIGAVLVALAIGERFPSGANMAAVPWWGWTGGALGLGFVLAMVATADTLGAALFIGLTVTASTIASVALDHFGWIGFAPHPAGIGRLIGAVLMIAGVALIAIF